MTTASFPRQNPYENIVKVLEAKVICGDVSGYLDQGRSPLPPTHPNGWSITLAEHDMVIIGNRWNRSFFAIEIGASCDHPVHQRLNPMKPSSSAPKSKGLHSSRPALYDSYTVARLINQSMPIDFFMTAHHILSFSLEDYTDDVKESHGRSATATSRCWMSTAATSVSCQNAPSWLHRKSSSSWWTTNEKNQAVNGIECADILRDHRPPPSGRTGKHQSGLFPQPAAGLHCHHHLPALP